MQQNIATFYNESDINSCEIILENKLKHCGLYMFSFFEISIWKCEVALIVGSAVESIWFFLIRILCQILSTTGAPTMKVT
jgi:hypothetical protein